MGVVMIDVCYYQQVGTRMALRSCPVVDAELIGGGGVQFTLSWMLNDDRVD
jgi:hypothetical protein